MTTPTPEPARAEPVGGVRDEYGEIKHMRAWPAEPDRVPDATALSRALSMHDALPDDHRPSDNEPLRNCLPGIWPTVGDLRALLALAPASDAGLAEVDVLTAKLRLYGAANRAFQRAESAGDQAGSDNADRHADRLEREILAAIAALRADNGRLRADAAGRGERVSADIASAVAAYDTARRDHLRDCWLGAEDGEHAIERRYETSQKAERDLLDAVRAYAGRHTREFEKQADDLRARIAAAPAPATDGTGGRSDG